MGSSFTTSRRVEFRDTDAAGIVHFASFFEWMEEVEHEFLRQLGVSVMMVSDGVRVSWPRVHTSCDYHSVLRFADVVDVDLTLAKLGTSSVTYHFAFRFQEHEVASGKVVTVCCRINDDQPPQSVPIPDTVREKLSQAMKSRTDWQSVKQQ